MTNGIGDATNGITLLPCPFCGGEAQAMHMDLDSIEEGWKVWGVWCVDDLNAEDYRSHGHYIDNYATEAEAIEAWNTRAERTCHNKARYGNFKCDVCGAFLQLTDFDEEPMMTVGGVGYVPDYCPHCGAKVERGGAE